MNDDDDDDDDDEQIEERKAGPCSEDEWQSEMSAIGAFDDCATFTYEDENRLGILQKAEREGPSD